MPGKLVSLAEIASGILIYVKIALPVLLPIPGLIAFYWAWKDRRYKRAADTPYGTWKINKEPDENGWYLSRIDIKNRWDEPLYADKIEIKGVRGATIKLHTATSPEEVDGLPALPIAWSFWSATQTGNNASSGGTEIYFKLAGCSDGSKALREHVSQKPPKSSVPLQEVSQQGYSTPLSEDEIAFLGKRLRLVLSLRSANNRHTRCIIPARWNKTPIKEKPARARTTTR